MQNGDAVEFEQALIVPRAARRMGGRRVREGPDRQPRRDRAAGRARLPRARASSPWRSTPRPTPDSAVVALRRRGRADRPARAGRSYLHIPAIIGAAQKTGADAIHPGYGFLSEDPYFAEICADDGITFIGPPPEVMEKVGDKATARDLMPKAGLPLLPGTIEPVSTVDEAQRGRRRDRLPGDHQGRRRRRRARHERRPRRAEDLARALPDHARDRAGGLQGHRGLHRALPRGAPPHRGAARLRHARQRRLLLRARLLGPAPPPEADRGGAVDPPDDEVRRTSASAPSRGALAVGYTGAGHDGVPARRRAATSTSWR